MPLLEIADSCLDGKEVVNEYQAPRYMAAVDRLREQFESGAIPCVSLARYGSAALDEAPIWYGNVKLRTMGTGRPVINRCSFFTSHYVGTFSDGDTTILIKPRFGQAIFGYLAQYAANLYLPEQAAAYDVWRAHPSWLITLIWKAMLNRALTSANIPKQYVTESNNQRHYRGRLAIKQHLHANIVDQSRFYCQYHKLSVDTTINRAIRYTLRLLRSDAKVAPLVQEFYQYDKRLESFGVSDARVSPRDISAIRYNKMTGAYAQVMDLSRLIIENHDSRAASSGNNPHGMSYFLDVAELWELYLLRLLQHNLVGYKVYSPNVGTGDFLLDGHARAIRPDILIERDGQVVMIIDAKYKRYSQIGPTAAAAGSVSREDLYQMSTYMYHYGSPGLSLTGLFVAPHTADGNDLRHYMGTGRHRIGIVNLPLDASPTLAAIHAAEQAFVSRIQTLLEEE